MPRYPAQLVTEDPVDRQPGGIWLRRQRAQDLREEVWEMSRCFWTSLAGSKDIQKLLFLYVQFQPISFCICEGKINYWQAPKRFLVDNRMLNATTDGIVYRPASQSSSIFQQARITISNHGASLGILIRELQAMLRGFAYKSFRAMDLRIDVFDAFDVRLQSSFEVSQRTWRISILAVQLLGGQWSRLGELLGFICRCQISIKF